MNKHEKKLVSDLPNLLIDWHPTKNGTLFPYNITAGSGKKVWWKCHVCGYEWEASVCNRAKGRGCSYCSKKILIEGVNDFATVYPKAASEWNYEKNYPMTPNMVRANSNKKYWFKCENGHNWEVGLNQRRKNNCPYCGSQKLLKGYNDLATKNPLLCKEWNYEKNFPCTPADVMQFSNIKVWWKCKICGNEWQTTVNARSSGTGCPKCRNDYKVSEAERIIFFYIKKQFKDAIISYRPQWLKKREIDIYIPSLSLAIEYDGEVWHKDISKDIEKTKTIFKHRIFLIRLREEKCPVLNDNSYQIVVTSQNYKYSRMNQPINEIFRFINERYSKSVVCDVDVERDYQDILSLESSDKQEKSLYAINPKLCNEWDYKKNKLKPQNVLPESNKIVWWKCSKGHEWQASISNRNKGRGCPICSNKKILIGFNDLLTTNPELASEWDYAKNIPLLPQDISYGAHTSVWWKCNTCGYKWKTSVANRQHNGCPQCAIIKRAESNMKNRAIYGETDLLSQFPEIAKEWHSTKNGNIIPQEISIGSHKVVWWLCNKGHEWKASVVSRTTHNNRCPYCEDKKVLEGYNDLLTIHPELCEEWNYEQNVSVTPNRVTKKYSKKVWWKCKNCGHEWQTTIRSRINGSGCNTCATKRRIDTRINNLLNTRKTFLALNPDAAKDWDYEKNYPLKPEDVTPSSGKSVWWRCHICGYEWKTSINHVNHGTGCRVCKHKGNHAKRRKKVINLDTGMIFDSISRAAQYYNIDISLISMCCSGKIKTAHGYRWKLLNDIATDI